MMAMQMRGDGRDLLRRLPLARHPLRLGDLIGRHLGGNSTSEHSASNRDNEKTRIGQQDFAVRLRRIGVAQSVTVAGEEGATLIVGEKLQERLQRGTRKPVGNLAHRYFKWVN